MTDKKKMLKAKPLALRLIMSVRNDDTGSVKHTFAEVEKVMREDAPAYSLVFSALVEYAVLALKALDEHVCGESQASREFAVGDNWGSQLLEFWLTHALDAEAGGTDD